jgi:hypothetical protein
MSQREIETNATDLLARFEDGIAVAPIINGLIRATARGLMHSISRCA